MAKERWRMFEINGKQYTFYEYDMTVLGKLCLFLIALGIAMTIYTKIYLAFHYPSELDFETDDYQRLAKDFATEYVMNRDKQVWINKGFTYDKTDFKCFTIQEGSGFFLGPTNPNGLNYKYFGQGLYQILTGDSITLGTKQHHDLRTANVLNIHNTYIITVKSTPKRNWYGTVDLRWQVLDVKLVKRYPTDEKIDKTIKNWAMYEPPKPKANW